MLLYQVSVHLPSGFRGEDFKKSANEKQELPAATMFVNRSGQNEHSLWKVLFKDAHFVPIR
jgi:hypothetical protein